MTVAELMKALQGEPPANEVVIHSRYNEQVEDMSVTGIVLPGNEFTAHEIRKWPRRRFTLLDTEPL